MTINIKEFVTPIVKSNKKSYRSIAKNPAPNKTPILYEDGRCLSHNTPWRWVNWMSLIVIASFLLNPETCTKETVSPSKNDNHTFSKNRYQSEERLEELHRARWLINNRNLGEKSPPAMGRA